MMRLFVSVCLAAVLLPPPHVCASAEADAPLLIEINIACGPAQLQQQVLVAESSDLRVVTRTEGIAWTLSVHAGRVVDDTVEVALTLNAVDTHGARLTRVSRQPVKLKLNEYRPPAVAHDRLAAFGLWVHRGTDVTPWLMQAILRRDDGWQAAAADLAKCGDEPTTVLPALAKLLADRSLDEGSAASKSVRVAVAQALGVWGHTAKSEALGLTRALNDENPYVQLAAAVALWDVDRDDAAVRTAFRLVDHRETHVRYRAARAVELIAPGSSAAVDVPDALAELIHDDDGYVRLAAARALLAMGMGDVDPAVRCLTELSKNGIEGRLRRLAQHVLERHRKGFRPDPLPEL